MNLINTEQTFYPEVFKYIIYYIFDRFGSTKVHLLPQRSGDQNAPSHRAGSLPKSCCRGQRGRGLADRHTQVRFRVSAGVDCCPIHRNRQGGKHGHV